MESRLYADRYLPNKVLVYRAVRHFLQWMKVACIIAVRDSFSLVRHHKLGRQQRRREKPEKEKDGQRWLRLCRGPQTAVTGVEDNIRQSDSSSRMHRTTLDHAD